MSEGSERAYPGRFIVIEGIDGCGSTTQSRKLVEALSERGRDARHTAEPSTGPVGSLIRAVLERRVPNAGGDGPRSFRWSTLALLFSADRLDHLDTFVIPALQAGAVVVSDRYDLSSLAYQSVTAPEQRAVVPWIRQLNQEALRPDLTIVLDVSADEAELRRRERGGAEELFETQSLQRRLAEVYQRAEVLVPGDRLVHVPGGGDIGSITARVLNEVGVACPELGSA